MVSLSKKRPEVFLLPPPSLPLDMVLVTAPRIKFPAPVDLSHIRLRCPQTLVLSRGGDGQFASTFIHLLYFCPPQSQLETIVRGNWSECG